MRTVLFANTYIIKKNNERKHVALYQQSLDFTCTYKMRRMGKTVYDFDTYPG